MANKGKTAVLAGGLAVVAIGAIALSSRKAQAASRKGGAGTRPANDDSGIAPTTGQADQVREGVEAILQEIPEAGLDMFVLGSVDNAVSLTEQGGADGLLAVYTPDDIGAMYLAVPALGTASAADLAGAQSLIETLDATSAETIQLTGKSIWLDEGAYFDALEGGHRMDPVVDKFLAAQTVLPA